MDHSVIYTKALGQANNRYGPTAARSVSTEPIRLKTTTVDSHAHVLVPDAAAYIGAHGDMAALPFLKSSTPLTRETNLRQDQDRRVALTDPADTSYRIDREHDPSEDLTIAYDDSEIGVPWPLPVTVMSDSDRMARPLRELTVEISSIRA